MAAYLPGDRQTCHQQTSQGLPWARPGRKARWREACVQAGGLWPQGAGSGRAPHLPCLRPCLSTSTPSLSFPAEEEEPAGRRVQCE